MCMRILLLLLLELDELGGKTVETRRKCDEATL